MKPEDIFKLWQEGGDDFAVFRHESGGGVVMVKTNDALEAVLKGVGALRERKSQKGTYER